MGGFETKNITVKPDRDSVLLTQGSNMPSVLIERTQGEIDRHFVDHVVPQEFWKASAAAHECKASPPEILQVGPIVVDKTQKPVSPLRSRRDLLGELDGAEI